MTRKFCFFLCLQMETQGTGRHLRQPRPSSTSHLPGEHRWGWAGPLSTATCGIYAPLFTSTQGLSNSPSVKPLTAQFWVHFLFFYKWHPRTCLHLSNSPSVYRWAGPAALFSFFWAFETELVSSRTRNFAPSLPVLVLELKVWHLDPSERFVSWEKQWFDWKLLS